MQRIKPTAAPPAGATVPRPPTSRSLRHLVGIAGVGLAVLLSACSLHVSKNGVSGNILGHSFSGAKGSLPAGFPSDVPTPDSSRVLAGGGADNNWDVAFAISGTFSAGTMAYESKLRSAGYAISNYQSGTTPVTGSTGAGSTATTITASGATFEATDPHWRIQVASGTTSSANGSGLRAGEFALNITVLPASTTTPSS
jgi:hypothetical protein